MVDQITRRTALTAGLAASAASCASTPTLMPYVSGGKPAVGTFAHGVAAGDPGPNSIVIWSRVSVNSSDAVTVSWEVSNDETFSTIVASGSIKTGPSRDWTVKAQPKTLEPAQTYFYRFSLGDAQSPIGRAKTLPVGSVEQARFAVISCSNYPFGYFNVYDLISREDDFDAVIHLGDYIYEYGREGYGGTIGAALGREHEPAHEITSLDDYRTRYAQYRADGAAQAMHARHAIIPIWDDHETANNSWQEGAENHQSETEGEWNARKRAALQAYYEWMPVREPTSSPEAFFRSYSYGNLLTLTAIETRLMARSKQFEYSAIVPTLKSAEDVQNFRDNILWDETREMLGGAQLDFLDRTFRDSVAAGQPWRLIANQIIMAKVTSPDLSPYMSEEDIVALEQEWSEGRAFVEFSKLGLPSNLDAWDGYPAARERFYKMVQEAGADGMIVVTGDTHTWWANDLITKDGTPIGVELGTNSVTSPSPYRSEFLGGKGKEYSLLTNRKNKDVRYLSGDDHGFIDLTINHDKAYGAFHAVDSVESQSYNAFKKAGFEIDRKSGPARFSGKDGLGFKEGFIF